MVMYVSSIVDTRPLQATTSYRKPPDTVPDVQGRCSMLLEAFGRIRMHLNMYGGLGAQMGSCAPAVKSTKLSARDLQRSPDPAKQLYMQHTTFTGVIACVWMLGDATNAL